MNDRILSLLGLCRRAGKLVIGADPSVESITKGKSQIIIYAKDFSKSSAKPVLETAHKNNIKTYCINRSKDEISREENYMIKYKVKDVANDLGVSNKKITEILEKHCGVTKKTMTALDENELDVIFSVITKENSVSVADVFEAVPQIAQRLGIDESGYRVVNNCGSDAGQTVFHIHFHILGGDVGGKMY